MWIPGKRPQFWECTEMLWNIDLFFWKSIDLACITMWQRTFGFSLRTFGFSLSIGIELVTHMLNTSCVVSAKTGGDICDSDQLKCV